MTSSQPIPRTPRELPVLVVAIIAVVLMTLPLSARSQAVAPITATRIEPNPASAGAQVRAVFMPTPAAFGTAMTITRSGNTLTLTQEIDFLIIGTPPPPMPFEVTLGAFAPGRYTVIYAPTSGGVPYAAQTLGFTVVPNAVPTTNPTALALFVVALLGFGALIQRKR